MDCFCVAMRLFVVRTSAGKTVRSEGWGGGRSGADRMTAGQADRTDSQADSFDTLAEDVVGAIIQAKRHSILLRYQILS